MNGLVNALLLIVASLLLAAAYLGYVDPLEAALASTVILVGYVVEALTGWPLTLGFGLLLLVCIATVLAGVAYCWLAVGVVGLVVALLAGLRDSRLLVAAAWLTAPLAHATPLAWLLIAALQALGTIRLGRLHPFILPLVTALGPLLPWMGFSRALPAYMVAAAAWSVGAAIQVPGARGCPLRADATVTRYSLVASLLAALAGLVAPELSLLLTAAAYVILASSLISPVVERVGVRKEGVLPKLVS